jgi:preprotein translocase subunit SecG
VTLFITLVHVFVCFALIAIVLLQQGKGADIGAAFGAGASQTVFGGRGAGSFLSKLTTGSAIVFMVTSLVLSYFAVPSSVDDLLSEESVTIEESLPAEPAPPESSFPEPTPVPGPGGSDVPSGFEEIPAPGGGQSGPPGGSEEIPPSEPSP